MTDIHKTSIDGLLKIDLKINSDQRGSFTELYHAQKLANALPDFKPVQTNLSKNSTRGITRGIHAEPWNKYITPIGGEVFVAIVDLRKQDFGKVETFELSFGQAIYVPQGCANSYQTLSKSVDYLYHVDRHWSPDVNYTSLHPFDPELKINWPIGQDQAVLSEKDSSNPKLSEINPL